jgi:hypothetical protein
MIRFSRNSARTAVVDNATISPKEGVLSWQGKKTRKTFFGTMKRTTTGDDAVATGGIGTTVTAAAERARKPDLSRQAKDSARPCLTS